jgi:chemotaxis protein methyltransferase CheR
MELAVYQQIKRSVKSLLNIDLDHYKDEQMRRRLDSWLLRSGAVTWADYFRRVRAEPAELARLRNYLTINVSAFFRDPERWRDLREHVLARLLRARPRLRIWSAGCSIGAEPYSLAILLDELTPLRRHALIATDLDRGALARAQARGPFSDQDLQNVSADRRAQYFEPGGPPVHVKASVAKRIEFREHDLLADEFEGDFDLIVCRNVVIYFTNTAKERLYQKFQMALRPGGVLFVGSTEIIPHAPELGLRSCGISLYQKEIRD